MIQQPALVNLVISSGEPAGVGPEVSVAAALAFLREQPVSTITLLGDPSLIPATKIPPALSNRLKVESIALGAPAIAGQLNPANAQYVLNVLDAAVKGCLNGRFDAMVTAPIQKSVINEGDTSSDGLFTGHTEYLAKLCRQEHVVMMLCATLPAGFLGLQKSRDLRVALVTTHLPLKEVPDALDRQHILETIQIVDRDLRTKFGIDKPVIRVAGLNPHAGESGYLGREEIDVIAPAIEAAKQLGIQVSGPYPGDTMFDANGLDGLDAFIAMYHDQGLAPFKFVSFGGGVNVTLGLPIIRTSVDHGTALDLAGKGLADSGSMLEALRLAYQLAVNMKNVKNLKL
ncbi:MAG: 4-hydroxythreonine-4-phosphate dehydrogenase PdxA [Polynucleobacter sp. 24-46-87]|jgi:4-hydroxythreonine-4-phosphate dehydrogenase|uniref:4-hydroxythreonine-4-phosphate dehydrogenase PdxA n=1 Tax=unclassified Polynucleobacter TaxID=2640945 RepID=UPI000BCE16E1|nr:MULTISPECIES: 4-hydroxythreonine-4-phosphate dehydrogenase PdxA [unclassified Polynucleobacter]OYY20937.1 MAG: 4-hydroxythreonine-4-phosphate dehydrogenase PdxA [Polynucleobacter sp. 35-46-11]OZA15880.1 MAG: 4-hydroxythreonine-4-phosphate dehydrogenase PdxA [Polynucleobacter sp. 24-46-87]OZA78105.1 MAG: 4-hydroxythreonine-4-phosphate dehydrogenase PdxA [Polynucleobacter sp. 39-46-10]